MGTLKSREWKTREWNRDTRMRSWRCFSSRTSYAELIRCSTRQQCQRTGILAFHTRFSRDFHPCLLVPRFPLPRFPRLHFWRSRVFHSRVFSRSLLIKYYCYLLVALCHLFIYYWIVHELQDRQKDKNRKWKEKSSIYNQDTIQHTR